MASSCPPRSPSTSTWESNNALTLRFGACRAFDCAYFLGYAGFLALLRVVFEKSPMSQSRAIQSVDARAYFFIRHCCQQRVGFHAGNHQALSH